MKKCPFCAEEIQDDAIKCKHCSEFLTKAPLSQEHAFPWYFSRSFILIALLCVGPFALPLIWWRPKTSLVWKMVWTLVILLLSWYLYLIAVDSLTMISEYYQLLDSL